MTEELGIDALLHERMCLDLLGRELARESHVICDNSAMFVQHMRNAIFLDHGAGGSAQCLVERAEEATHDRSWLRLRNRPWVPASRAALAYSLPVAPVSWTRDGKYLVHNSELLDPVTGQVQGKRQEDSKPTVGLPAWSPDGSMYATADEHGNLALRDADNGRIAALEADHDRVLSLA
jgi:hypothetical protein